MDSSDDNESFSNEKDFEGGEWVNGEFFYRKAKKGRSDTKEERIYGSFGVNASSDEGSGEEIRNHSAKLNKRSRKRMVHEISEQKPLTFVSQSYNATAKEAAAVPSTELEDIIEVEAEFKGMLTGALGNDAFSKMVAEEEDGGSKVKSKTATANPVNVKALGTWEKHTKGIGMKLLQKFGFKGRLGAKEDGVSKPIEVVVRPGAQGLGFGDFTEASALKENKKFEAEWRGVDFKDEEPTKKLSSVEVMAESKSWKKGKSSVVAHSKMKQKKALTAEDLLKQYEASSLEAAPVKQVIIDMRGKDARVITDMSDICSAPPYEASSIQKPKLGQELLYNINIVCDLVEKDVRADISKLSKTMHMMKSCEEDIISFEAQLRHNAPRAQRLSKLLLVLDRVQQRQETDAIEGTSSVSVDALCRLYETLLENFTDEFKLFGLLQMLPTLALPVIKSSLATWNLLQNPTLPLELYQSWQPLFDSLRMSRVHQLSDEVNATARFDIVAREMITHEICASILPVMRRRITNDWCVTDVEQAKACAALLRSVIPILDKEEDSNELINSLVLPKLSAAISTWNPAEQKQLIHEWIHPWLSVLGQRLTVMFPDIRRKMNQYLRTRKAGDEWALQSIRPWVGVFDAASFDHLIISSIVPKLVSALRDLVVNPQNQDVVPIGWVMDWVDLVPGPHFSALWCGEFFPKWFKVLASWLCSDAADFGEISEWYTQWKTVFPESLLSADEGVARAFEIALAMMSAALEFEEEGKRGADALMRGAGVDDDSIDGTITYFKIIEKLNCQTSLKSRLDDLSSNSSGSAHSSLGRSKRNVTGGLATVSFKEIVEAFAEKHGIVFLPKGGIVGTKGAAEGKQLWQFGTCTCFLDQNVVFIPVNRGAKNAALLADWTPIALEDLLTMASR